MSLLPDAPPTGPFKVTNALMFAAPPVASSSGAAIVPLKNVALGSACCHVPAVRPGPLEIVQPATVPSIVSSIEISVPTAPSARYHCAGAVGGSNFVPLPAGEV